MGSPFFHEFKKRASFFIKEKINTARLALTDVTPIQLMTEDATNENSWPPDTRAIGVISRATFEVDDYNRVVDIIHDKLLVFEGRKNWRGPYKALILLEHVLTHGPLRVAGEFKDDVDLIKGMRSFQYIDEKGFNWGTSVTKLSERVLKLIEDSEFLKLERASARKLTRGIKGFGSFFIQSPSSGDSDSDLQDSSYKVYGRCNSEYNTSKRTYSFLQSDCEVSGALLVTDDENHLVRDDENHPFCDNEQHQTKKFL